MKKMLMLAALSLAAPAATAVTWEYATYTAFGTMSESWSTPAGTVSGKTFTDLVKAMKCERESLIGLLNCIGADGWELTAYTRKTVAGIDVESYLFKRPKP